MSKNSYIITGAFLLAIGGISVGSLLAKDREFSPNENRYLSGLPKCSVDRIFSGDFQEDLENYLNDQILGRDQWITVKTGIQKTCGDTDIGGAYVGKDGYDFEKILPEDIDDKLVNRNIQSVQQFLEKSTAQVEKDHMSFLLVPTSGLVMKEYLPKNAILFDQEAYMDRVKDALKEYRFMDGRKIFQSEMDSKTKEASKTEADSKTTKHCITGQIIIGPHTEPLWHLKNGANRRDIPLREQMPTRQKPLQSSFAEACIRRSWIMTLRMTAS